MSMNRGRGGGGFGRGGGEQITRSVSGDQRFQPYPSRPEGSSRGRGSDRGGGGPPRGYRGRGGGGGGHQPDLPTLAPGESRPALLRTNVFVIKKVPDIPYYQYTAVDPEPRSQKFWRVLIDKLQTQNPSSVAQRGIYDGKNLFYSSLSALAGTYPIVIERRSPPRQGQPARAPESFQVKLTRTASDIIMPLQEHEAKGDRPLLPVVVNLFQLLSQESARQKSEYWNARRSIFFDGTVTTQLGGGVVLWHGFVQSVKAVKGNVVINVDIASTVMWRPGPLLDIVRAILEDAGHRGPPDQFNNTHPMWRTVDSMIRRLRIQYPSSGGVLRERSIRRIVPNAGDVRFTKDGTQVTVAQYFQKILNKPVQSKIFGVCLDDEGRVVIPAEICQVSAGRRYIRQLNKNQQSTALRDMTQIPSKRWDNIQAGLRFFNYEQSPYVLQAHMEVDRSAMIIQGRQIGPPQMKYAQSAVDVSRGAWDMPRGGRYTKPMNISHWEAYDLTMSRGDTGKMFKFLDVFQQCCRENGMNVPQTLPELKAMHGFQPQMVNKFAGPPPGYPGDRYEPLLIFFLPTAGASDLHRQIKYWADRENGVPTQCIMADKFNPTRLFGGNLAMKVNAKLGGVNCVAYNPNLDSFKDNTIVIGADVSHPAPGLLNRPSFPAVVGSVDSTFTRYSSCLDVQGPRVDDIQNLDKMVAYLLFNWAIKHEYKMPEHVFYFRDGISEGQYEITGTHERERIQSAWALAVTELRATVERGLRAGGIKQRPSDPAKSQLHLTIQVVEKKHSTRFAPEGPLSKQNVPAGTVVVQDVIARNYENFYLVSQAGILGTSRPAHYVILQRDPRVTLDMCQNLAYFLCHVCARTTKSVAIPAPVFYADLLCAEAMNYIDPDAPVLNQDVMTTVSGDAFMIDMEAWRQAMSRDGPWRPGPNFVRSRIHNRLFFL